MCPMSLPLSLACFSLLSSSQEVFLRPLEEEAATAGGGGGGLLLLLVSSLEIKSRLQRYSARTSCRLVFPMTELVMPMRSCSPIDTMSISLLLVVLGGGGEGLAAEEDVCCLEIAPPDGEREACGAVGAVLGVIK